MKSVKSSFRQKIGLAGLVIGVSAALYGKEIKQTVKQIKKTVKDLVRPQQRIQEFSVQQEPQNVEYDDLQKLMVCPISLQLMKDPCILSRCGHSFQRSNIARWVNQNKKCPICQVRALTSDIKPNFQLQGIIIQHQKNKRIPPPQEQE